MNIIKSTDPQKSIRRSILFRIVRLFALLASLGTLSSFFAQLHWIPDILSNFRIQYIFLIFVYLTWVACLRKFGQAIALAILLIPNLWSTLPYLVHPFTKASSLEPVDSKSFRLVSLNVLRTNEAFQATLNLIIEEDADFVFLMEVQEAWGKYLEGVQNKYPYQKVLAVPDYTGVAFLSKVPWTNLDVVMLGEVLNPSLDVQFASDNNSLESLRIIATHPLPPFGDILTKSRDRQLNVLAKRLKGVEASLLIGDLNLSPWSPRFAKVLEAGDLTDASLGFGWSPTLTPLPTLLGGVKVDHVLRGNKIDVKDVRFVPIPTSDHRMLVFDLSVWRDR
ncbi:MAG: endonuclease/exonuclease/phosphatase family protein [Pirellulaceae bacterium]|nr:endonuclease/exonuclease/phosphatase family protein [Pirellulaceae bacterium]